VFNATFSNISAISWRPVLVVEEATINQIIYHYSHFFARKAASLRKYYTTGI
jgi:hypothetical protein